MKQEINGLVVHTLGDSKAKPLIFLHGFPYDHTMWNEQLNFFSEDYFCVTYDIRGLGESLYGDGQFTMESFVDDLEIIINQLQLNKPILCGLSMGGYISLRAVERIEEKLSALILCDTKSTADNDEGKLKRAAGIKQVNEEGTGTFVRGFIPNCFAENYIKNEKENYELIIERSVKYDAIGIKGCLLAMAARTDTTGYLSKINLPVLLICGEKDKLTPPEVMKEMLDKIKHSEFVKVKNAGHMTPIEKPDEFNKAVEKFLSANF